MPRPTTIRPQRYASLAASLNVAGQIGGQASPGAAAMAYSKGTPGRIRPRLGGLDAGLCGEFTAASAGDDSCLCHAYLRRGAQHGAEARRSPRSPVSPKLSVAGAHLDLAPTDIVQ